MNTQISDPRRRKEIRIGEVLSESWSLISGLKMPIFLRILALLLIDAVIPGILFLIFLLGTIKGSVSLLVLIVPVGIVYFFIALFLSAIIAASCILLGVRQAAGMSLDVKLVNAECMQQKWAIFGLSLIAFGIGVALKLISFIFIFIHIPGFIVSLLTFLVTLYFVLPIKMFALPLLLTKHCSIGEALKSGFTLMKQYWLPAIACYVIMLVLAFISELLIILWIWTIPMFFAMFGIFFRDAYGLQNKRNVQAQPRGQTPSQTQTHQQQQPEEPEEQLPDLEPPSVIDNPPEEEPPAK